MIARFWMGLLATTALGANAHAGQLYSVGVSGYRFVSQLFPNDVRVLDATPDASKLLFTAKGVFTPACDGLFRQLYISMPSKAVIRRVSEIDAGVGIAGNIDTADLSDDGRYVVFTTTSNPGIANDTNGTSDVYLKDLMTDQVTLVSQDGVLNNAVGDSFAPTISGNGRYIAFDSRGGPGGHAPSAARLTYLYDRDSDTYTLVSRSTAGIIANADCFVRDINSDGRRLVFESQATNLTADDGAFSDVFVRDTQFNVTRKASIDTGGGNANGPSYDARISGIGNRVIFTSTATDLDVDDTNSRQDIYTYEVLTQVVSLQSSDQVGVVGNGQSYAPDISPDGTKLTFITTSTNLGPTDNNGLADYYRRNLDNGNYIIQRYFSNQHAPLMANPAFDARVGFEIFTDSIVPADPAGTTDVMYISDLTSPIGNWATTRTTEDNLSRNAAMGGIMEVYTFDTQSTNWIVFANDNNSATDVVSRTSIGSFELLSSVQLNPLFNTVGNNESKKPDISDDGSRTFFESLANNLIFGDGNGVSDIYFSNTSEAVGIASRSSSGTLGNSGSFNPSCNKSGRYVAFESDASNLVSNDTNNKRDIFLRDLDNNTTIRISVSSTGAQANGDCNNPDFGRDSNWIYFDSDATNLVAVDSNGVRDVFAHNFVTGETIRVSQTPAGNGGNGLSRLPSASEDGFFVAYESNATNLVAGDNNGVKDIHYWNRFNFVNRRASNSPTGQISDGESTNPAISADGSRVSFCTFSLNVIPGDYTTLPSLAVKDMGTGGVIAGAVDWFGRICQNETDNIRSSWSGDGRCLAFESSDKGMVKNDSLGQKAIYRNLLYPTMISGNVFLQLYFGSWVPVTFQLEQNSQIVQTRLSTNTLLIPGYRFATDLTGAGTMYVDAPKFLRKAIPVSDFGVDQTINMTLINGDCNDDNEVGPSDFTILSATFGKMLGDVGYDDRADLNGDEEVGPGDFTILSLNFGEIGD